MFSEGSYREVMPSRALSIYDALEVSVSLAAPAAECLVRRLRQSVQEVSSFATRRHLEGSDAYGGMFGVSDLP